MCVLLKVCAHVHGPEIITLLFNLIFIYLMFLNFIKVNALIRVKTTQTKFSG